MSDVRECNCPKCGGIVRLLASSAQGEVRCPFCRVLFQPKTTRSSSGTGRSRMADVAPGNNNRAAANSPKVGCGVVVGAAILIFFLMAVTRGGGMKLLFPLLFIGGIVFVVIQVLKNVNTKSGSNGTSGNAPPERRRFGGGSGMPSGSATNRPPAERKTIPVPPPIPASSVTTTGLFQFSCPTCGKQLEAEEGQRGLKASCPGCNQSLVVPAAVATNNNWMLMPEPDLTIPPPNTPAQPAQKRSSYTAPSRTPILERPRSLPRKLQQQYTDKKNSGGGKSDLIVALILADCAIGVLLILASYLQIGVILLALGVLAGLPLLSSGSKKVVHERSKKKVPRAL